MTVYNATQFSVDSNGAYVIDLHDADGTPILFPRTTIDGKRRGGVHVCFPYFGVDAAGALPQHGYGRDVEWVVEAGDDSTEMTCSHVQRDENSLFQGLSATIQYRVRPEHNEFKTDIVIVNPNAHAKPLPVSPGFHPYFAVDPQDIKLNGVHVNMADFEPYKDFPNTNSMTIESGGRTITVSSDNLRHMVVWTDAKGDYLCVEPTLSGHSFNSSKQNGGALEAADQVRYGYTITWS